MSRPGEPDQDTTVRCRSQVTGAERGDTITGRATTAWTTGATEPGTTAGTVATPGTLARAGVRVTASGLRTGMAGQTGNDGFIKLVKLHSLQCSFL